MTSISDQFSAVRKAQFDAQVDFFHSMTTQALEGAGRLAALNLAVSRDAVQRSLGAGFALANARDPRDVLLLGGQAEEQLRTLFAYGRELLGIAGSVRPYAMRPKELGLTSAQAPQLAIETVEVIERNVADTIVEAAPPEAAEPVEALVASSVEAAPEAPAAQPVAVAALATDAVAEAEPVVVAEPIVVAEPEAALAAPVPVAEPKAIAKAAGKGTARAAVAPHPAAAPLAGLSAAPAPAQVTGKRRK